MPTLDPLPDSDEPVRIGVLDRNRTMLARASRVVRVAAGLQRVAAETDPATLRSQLSPDTQLLICEGAELELALEWTATRFKRAEIITWGAGPMDMLIEGARRSPRIRSILGWPTFQSMPRAWELALAVRRALQPSAPSLGITELFTGAPVVKKFRPRSSTDRDDTAAELGSLAERAGASGRTISRISEVSHELLMNAMYDAPVNHYGEARYAHDRRAHITLEDHEVPTARFATDGNLVAVQVNDPFGRLTRDHVLNGIARGQGASHASETEHIIDSSHGGAGLGLYRIYSGAAVTIVDVVVGHSTSVTTVFDIDVNPREARTMPPSLHVFDRTEV